MSDKPNHLVRTHAFAIEDAFEVRHPLNERSQIFIHRLSDQAGMQRAHVSLAIVPPEMESFIPHAHFNQEEWVYILDGKGMALLGEEEIEVGPGDFLGYPTDGTVHHLRNVGETNLVYLMGGERMPVEVSRFPTLGRIGVFREGQVHYYPEEPESSLPVSAWIAHRPSRA